MLAGAAGARLCAISGIFFEALDLTMGMRVSPEEELEGLDVPEMGTHGYPEVQGPNTVARHLPSGGSAIAPVGAAARAVAGGR